MAKAEASIRPFDFGRVFQFEEAPRDERVNQAVVADLHTHLGELEDQLAAALRARDEAVEAAWAQGHAAGLEQARSERAEAQLAATDALQAGLEDVSAQIAAVTDRLTRDSAELAQMAAEIMAGHALHSQPSRAFEEALGRALQQLASGAVLMVRAHPDSIAHFQQILDARQAEYGASLQMNLIADDQIAPQDAHISWGQGGLILNAEERRAAVMAELAPLLSPASDLPNT